MKTNNKRKPVTADVSNIKITTKVCVRLESGQHVLLEEADLTRLAELKSENYALRSDNDRLKNNERVNDWGFYSWRPIVSAPKDGTKIIGLERNILNSGNDRAFIAYFHDFKGGVRGWFERDVVRNKVFKVKPTFWMPLNDPEDNSEEAI